MPLGERRQLGFQAGRKLYAVGRENPQYRSSGLELRSQWFPPLLPPPLASSLPASYVSKVPSSSTYSAMRIKCLSGSAWAPAASVFSQTPPEVGVCLDTRTGEVLLGTRVLPSHTLELPVGFHSPGRFFSTGQSRHPLGVRWRQEDPRIMSRLFASASRMLPELSSSLPAPAALDLVSFLWQSRVMVATSKSPLSAGGLSECLDIGGTGVRMSAFSPISAEPSIFTSIRPKVSHGFSPFSAFLSSARPSSSGEMIIDESTGMVSSSTGAVVALGLPKNPNGAKVSFSSSSPWPGCDPSSIEMAAAYRNTRAVPTLLSRDPEESMRALVESWCWLSSRFSPRSESRAKVRCDFSLGSHWCILESAGTPLPRRADKEESRAARMMEEAKMKSALAVLAGRSQCEALSAFSRPRKFPARHPPARTLGEHRSARHFG